MANTAWYWGMTTTKIQHRRCKEPRFVVIIWKTQPHRRFEFLVNTYCDTYINSCNISFVYFVFRCWMSSQRILVSYITTVAFPCLVILCNSCMLGLVVFKLRGLRGGEWGDESTSGRRMNKAKRTRLWKDCATVLGLSCVLGLPWGLASTTYISLPGIYVFTILNSLQGQYVHNPHIKCALCS